MCERGFDLDDRLRERRSRTLYRDLQPADAVGHSARFAPDPGADLPVIEPDHQLVFAANNYLGLAGDERVVEAAQNAADVVGTGAGASRLVTGDTLVHRDLESRIADAKGTERALAFSSGYAANVGTIAALDPDVVFSDELNHASIVDGCRLADADVVVYDHCDPSDLRERMSERRAEPVAAGDVAVPNGGADESWLVVTDSVFSMDGTIAPFEALADLAEEFGAWLLADEAHATGCFVDGGGIVQRAGLEDRVQIQLGTLSKALGSQGGYVAGSSDLIEFLVNEARSFVYSTGLAPPAAAAAGEALHLARTTDRRARLWRNVDKLRDGLEDVGLDVGGETQILPVHVGDREDALALAAALRDRDVIAPAIRPPTVPEGTSRIRVAPMATHSAAELETCIDAFAVAADEVGVI
ncbi:7-keto-8-aminopelargonate synthetase-like enzyme [Salinarchaeum sp. Harcht-Bsk1]|uniref:aminotransferase class I/II-fold pyridoxal phosphate-dependent enzyme n=1 Tax=Salinarchaeum sp. Harcht-Bsk1 TaxID=1333523 RepID=UPI0003423E5A|nr:8-amino-7-oxononanoate synthase [Salinarchaeum sp. Harcht-Bsk1]AGN02897.1 7-keto-8-aminopelargonate synthetase-like enzyme [Salinarchaeum sp. Harcht-Bsk1]